MSEILSFRRDGVPLRYEEDHNVLFGYCIFFFSAMNGIPSMVM